MIFALLGALCIGLSLGLLGSGGSILTVPILLYLVHRPKEIAVVESLAIVGGIALSNAVPNAIRRLIDWRSVAFFGLPGMLGGVVGSLAARRVTPSVQLALFAIVMLYAAVRMLWGAKPDDSIAHPRQPTWKIAAMGFLVGILTGFVGVGGGFLIVPALVLFVGLPIRRAIGTSLCIIAMNSATSFVTHLVELERQAAAHPERRLEIDSGMIAIFLVVGVAGSLAGNFVGGVINQALLRRIFGCFLIAMGLYILLRETVFK